MNHYKNINKMFIFCLYPSHYDKINLLLFKKINYLTKTFRIK